MTISTPADTVTHIPPVTYLFGERAHEILRDGAVDHRDVTGLAVAVANADGTEVDLDDVLMVACPWWADLTARRRAGHLRRWMTSARAWVAAHPPAVPDIRVRTARHTIAGLAAAADRRSWGRCSCRRIYDTLLSEMWDGGRLRDHHVSERTIAERAGCDHTTVRRCRRHLVDAGLLTWRAGRGGRATSWTLVIHGPPIEVDAPLELPDRVDWSVDLYRWAGVGTDGARVDHLLARPHTVEQLAARLDLTPRRVRHVLTELAGLGRAVDTGSGWVRGPATLTDAARAAGPRVDGAGARQRHRHRLAQYGYRLYLRWRAEQAPRPNGTGGHVFVLAEPVTEDERRKWSRPCDADLPAA